MYLPLVHPKLESILCEEQHKLYSMYGSVQHKAVIKTKIQIKYASGVFRRR